MGYKEHRLTDDMFADINSHAFTTEFEMPCISLCMALKLTDAACTPLEMRADTTLIRQTL